MISVADISLKLIGSALSRVGGLALHKAIRVNKVEAALRGEVLTDEAVAKALHDFEVVIGSSYGELTEELDLFLRELERTGLTVALAEAAIIGKKSNVLRDAFINLHTAMIPEGQAVELFDVMFKSFQASLALMSKDPTLALLTRASLKEITQRVAAVDAKLASLLNKPTSIASPAEAAGVVEQFIKATSPDFRSIRIETHRGPRSIDINKIFIPSKLRHRGSGEDQRTVRREAASRRSQNQRRLIFDDPASSFSYEELRGGFCRIVILGDPGGGKSTLCQYLCNELAKRTLLHLQHPHRNDLDATLQRVPIRIVLRSFERARLQSPQLGIFDYICNEIRGLTGADASDIHRSVRYLLTFGRAALAFDGLDEILNIGRRREFVSLVTGFCEQFPLCPTVVTSRIVGYDDAPLSQDFEVLTLNKFDEPEISQYLEKFCRAYAFQNGRDPKESASQFLVQTARNAADLRQNPLMLGLMALLFVNKGDIPSNRPEIYKECAILIFEKWDQNREIRAQVPQFDFMELFRDLARTIFGNPNLEEGVSQDWLLNRTRDYFFDYYEDKALAYKASREVTAFITGRSWVMDAFGPDVYRFTHRTFLEFFFAQDLDQRHETLASLLKVLEPKILSQQWDVICHLAIQLKVGRTKARVTEVLTYLLKVLASVKSKKHTQAVSSFAARSLEYLSGSQPEMRRLVEQIVDKTFGVTEQNYVALGAIAQCCNSVIEHREFCQSVVAEALQRKLCGDVHERAMATWLVCDSQQRMFCSPDPSLRIWRDNILPRGVRQTVIESAESRNLEAAGDSVTEAFMYWVWYRRGFQRLFEKYGMKLLFGAPGTFAHGSGLLDLVRVLEAASDVQARAFSVISKEAATTALEVIGRHTHTPYALPRVSEYFRVGPPEWKAYFRRFSTLTPEQLWGAIVCSMLLAEAKFYDLDGTSSNHRRSLPPMFAEAMSSVVGQAKARSAKFKALEDGTVSKWLDGEWSLFCPSKTDRVRQP